MICPNCGNEVNDSAMNCPFCGMTFTNGFNQQGYDPNAFNQGYNPNVNNETMDLNGYQNNGYNQNGFGQSSDYGYQDNYNQQMNQYGSQNNYNQSDDYGYQNNYTQNNDYSYQNDYNQSGDYGYQSNYNQSNDYGYQNNYNQSNDYDYQNAYNQSNDYGYQNSYEQPKKKHGVLKAFLVIVLATAVGFGGFKGWQFLNKDTGSTNGTAVASTSASGGEEAMASLKSLCKELVDYTNQNPIGGADVDRDEAADEVAEYLAKFEKIENLPANVEEAAREMFVSYNNAYVNSRDNYDYQVANQEIADLSESFLESEEGDTLDSFKKRNQETLDEMKELYDDLSCPELYKDQYTKLGDGLSKCQDMFDRIIASYESNDLVKIRSSSMMAYHVLMNITKEVEHLGDVNKYADNFNREQISNGSAVYSELKEVFKLSYEDASNYEFKNTGSGKVSFKYDAISNIYPALYSGYDQFLFVEIGSVYGEKDVVIECQINGLTDVYSETVHLTSSLNLISVKPDANVASSNLTASRDAQMTVSITAEDGTLIDSQSFSVHIATVNDMGFDQNEFIFSSEYNFLCFFTPESQAVSELKTLADQKVSEITNGAITSIAGYQGPYIDNFWDAYYEASAVMLALSDYGVRYNMDAFSLEGTQHVQYPEESLNAKSGLCIETSLIVASVLRSAGYNTYILLPPGHAQVAIETWDGSGQYLLIETTALPNDVETTYKMAEIIQSGSMLTEMFGKPVVGPVNYLYPEEWYAYILQGQCDILDCNDYSVLGFSPLDH